MEDSVRLVHITTVPGSLGFVRGHVGYAKSKGLDVHAVSSPGELLTQFASDEKVPVHAVDMPRRITPLRDLVAIARLCRVFRAVHPHIVHSHTPKGGMLGMISAWITRVPVRIYHIHGLPMITAKGYKRVLLSWSEKAACTLAHQVLCVSHSIRDVAIAEGLCPSAKIKVLLNGSINGVDAEGKFNPSRFDEHARAQTRSSYGIPADAVVIGFVGRIVHDKGLVELVEAWKSLRGEFSDLNMLVVGAFESKDMVPPETEKVLKEDPRIILTGKLADVSQVYSAMDILALPSYREGFVVVALEAASMGLPVVATDVPGCRDAVVDGVTGTLVPPRDSTALALAVCQLIIDPNLRHEYGQSGRKRVLRDFRQEDMWEALYSEYTSLLSGLND